MYAHYLMGIYHLSGKNGAQRWIPGAFDIEAGMTGTGIRLPGRSNVNPQQMIECTIFPYQDFKKLKALRLLRFLDKWCSVSSSGK